MRRQRTAPRPSRPPSRRARAPRPPQRAPPRHTRRAKPFRAGRLGGLGGLGGFGGLAGAGRVVHGEFTVRTASGYKTVDEQVGAVTAVSSSQITVKSSDGYTHTYKVVSSTRRRRPGWRHLIGQGQGPGQRLGDAQREHRHGCQHLRQQPAALQPDTVRVRACGTWWRPDGTRCRPRGSCRRPGAGQRGDGWPLDRPVADEFKGGRSAAVQGCRWPTYAEGSPSRAPLTVRPHCSRGRQVGRSARISRRSRLGSGPDSVAADGKGSPARLVALAARPI